MSSKKLKPRLIKFTCPTCQARLAVPESMAGIEDDCPKCSSRIKAPLPGPDPQLAFEAAMAGVTALESSSDKIEKPAFRVAIKTPGAGKKSAPQTGVEKVAPHREKEPPPLSLFDEFLSAPLRPPEEKAEEKVPPQAEPMVAPASQQVLIPDKTDKAPPATVAPPLNEGNNNTSDHAPASLLIKNKPAEPKPIEEPASGGLLYKLGHQVAPTVEASGNLTIGHDALEHGEDPAQDLGMGEMIAGNSLQHSSTTVRHTLPTLGVGLMKIMDAPRHDRLLRRRRMTVIGIAIFLAVDVLIFGWIFKRRFAEWWHDRHQAAAKTEPKTADLRAPDTGTGTKTREEAKPPPLFPEPPPRSSKPEEIKPSGSPMVSAGVPPSDDTAPPKPQVSVPKTITPAEIITGTEIPSAKVPSPDPPPPVDPGPPMRPPEPVVKPSPTDLTPPPLIPAEYPVPEKEVPVPPSPPPLPPAISEPQNPEVKDTAAQPEMPPAAQTPSSTPTAKIIESGITSAARPALAALKSFLAASSWKERASWVQRPETVKGMMEKHYRKHPDGPISVARIDLIERYPSRNGRPAYCMFDVRGGDLKNSILVLVEEKNKATPLVDWEAFVEFKDHLLWEFLIKPGTPPAKFRVMIRRKHSFDKDIPDLARKEAFELSQPGADTSANAYAIKGGEASRILAQQLGWGDSVAVMVELAWHGEGEHAWVEVKSVPAFGWRG